jgi:acetoacetyl-CoA synthetase
VAGYLPNIPEAVIALLATAAIGAVWSVCSTDLSAEGVIDRIGQVEPKVFLTADGYHYDGKRFNLLNKAAAVAARLASCERVIVIRSADFESQLDTIRGAVAWDTFLAPYRSRTIAFEQFPFDHPLLILFSSGTSGAPKCIVHSAGGALLQNVKDLKLQFDVKQGDCIFWWTGTGWVVWNLMLFGLACEATVVLYDGSPFYPAVDALFDYAQSEHVTFLRLTPKYVEMIEKAGLHPGRTHDLSRLKCITVGGAPFGPAGYKYVYEKIKSDVQLASPAGGTDPLCALVSGNPISPVWAGEMQCRGLGVKLEVFDENAKSVVGKAGELVCTQSFPSMPLRFLNDHTGTRFRDTYFAPYPNVWRQGDWAEITARGGVIIYGRSDETLKVRGVRIGTAELYRQVEQIHEISDSVAVAYQADGSDEIILFVQLTAGNALDGALIEEINARIRHGASPRYVPDRIIAVKDIPRTNTGKVSESAVRAALHGRPVTNQNALVNPEALRFFHPKILAMP